MSQLRARLVIKGRVQGVFYRQSAKETAQSNNIFGWVRNLPNGDVEAVLEGPEQDIIKVIDWCQQGPPAARVDDVSVEWSAAILEFNGFSIR